MNTNKKLVAAARRAARVLARAQNKSYQQCLDDVAKQAGRPTWTAFLADPLPVDENAYAAATEPDFSQIAANDHITAIVRHAQQINAVSFIASPRAWNDISPTLEFTREDGSVWPIDARGLDLDTIADACLPNYPRRRPDYDNICYDMGEDMPTIDGSLMRALVRTTWNATPELVGLSATIDGSKPQKLDLPVPPREPKVPHSQNPTITNRTAPRPTIIATAKHMLFGANEIALKAMLKRGPLDTDHGPVVGITDRGKRIRLEPGRNLCAFSPPGTGRLAGIAIPALVTDEHTSYIVHDDGQLLNHTSGWRAAMGTVGVIRLDGGSRDAINPFGRDWIPERKYIKHHCDVLAKSIAPDDLRVTRLIAETASNLIAAHGETTLRAIYEQINSQRDHPQAMSAIALLMPLVDALAHEAIGRSTINPDMLRGINNEPPLTLYIVRDPTSSGARNRLAALIQSAIWLKTLTCGPGGKLPDGRQNGKRQVTTLIHDFHQMPQMPMLHDALSMGRSYGSGVIVMGPTIQTTQQYQDLEWMLPALSHLNLVLGQSDASELAQIDGYKQIEWNEASKLQHGRAIALTNSGMNTVRFRLPFFFEQPDMLARVYNPRTGQGPKPV